MSRPRARCAAMRNTTANGSKRRRRAHPKAGGSPSVPELIGSGLYRVHGRPGRAHRALSGHRRADRREPSPNARSIISGNPSRSRPASNCRWRAPGENGAWRAGGLMLQRVPPEGGYTVIADDVEDGWRRAMVLMSSATPDELVDPGIVAAPAVVPAVPRGRRAGVRDAPAGGALPLLARAHRRHPALVAARGHRGDARGRR